MQGDHRVRGRLLCLVNFLLAQDSTEGQFETVYYNFIWMVDWLCTEHYCGLTNKLMIIIIIVVYIYEPFVADML